MPWPFGPSPKRVREDVGRLGGWLKKYAEGRIEDMRAPSDLPRALMNPNDPASRAELQNFAVGVVGGINPAARASKAVRAAKPPSVRAPAVKLPDGRVFSTLNGTHASVVRELAGREGVDPEALATAVNNMHNFFGYLDGKKNFLTRAQAGARRVARGEPSQSGSKDFDSFELPHIMKAYGGPVRIREHKAPDEVARLAKQLLATIQDNRSGFSVRLNNGALAPATTGYAVGAGGVNKNTLTVPLDKLNLRQLTKWMKANPDAWRKGVLGGWVDDAGNAVIEPATLVDDLRAATQLGRERGEQAVGDLAKYARGEDGTIPLWRDKHRPK